MGIFDVRESRNYKDIENEIKNAEDEGHEV